MTVVYYYVGMSGRYYSYLLCDSETIFNGTPYGHRILLRDTLHMITIWILLNHLKHWIIVLQVSVPYTSHFTDVPKIVPYYIYTMFIFLIHKGAEGIYYYMWLLVIYKEYYWYWNVTKKATSSIDPVQNMNLSLEKVINPSRCAIF